MKVFTSTTALALAAVASTVSASSKITFKNTCTKQVDLYDNHSLIPLAPGATSERTLNDGYMGIFRDGTSPQATLAEFTLAGGKTWFDISIIPTGNGIGPEYCPSLDECKRFTGGVGYNTAMQIAPLSGINGAHCRVLTCLNDGCDDAYQFPKDDTKTHNCPDGTEFIITFCPGGAGGATPAPTTQPPTTAPPTTQPPTTAPPTTVPPTSLPPKSSVPPSAAPNSTAPVYKLRSINGGSASAEGETTTETETEKDAEAGVLENDVVSIETPAPVGTVAAPEETPTTGDESTTVGGQTGVTETNTQSSGGSASPVGTVMAVLLAVAAVAGVAVIVVMRRKKAELDAMDDKSPVTTMRNQCNTVTL
ncbi:hypothetical protein Poli38472_000243 [Pythium oligandrum]|uniref:Thaumatin-like protein n=1 Tax=Pythium oligandrum TaxID=41045 RepID=A0A8K1CBD5_PYTOL|nr:hypothetical protein Poli38472_000243 [Pythium oligandrum]|eukprot:TMW60201.1 hypothetical protein Poli38472_000243 [Pythium oligandrum]